MERVALLEKRFSEIDKLLASPEVLSNRAKYQSLAKERAGIEEIVLKFREFKVVKTRLKEAEDILNDSGDAGMAKLAAEEIESLKRDEERIQQELEKLSRDEPPQAKNVIVEIRAGTGGQEAGLFVADLYKMYTKYASSCGWKAEVMNSHPTGIGGLREIIFSVSGKDAYRRMCYESGTHRVQRIPVTETGGRIHTSAVTVAVLPEAEAVDIQIDPKELKIDVYRSSGPGGQGVNTTDSAVRITHLPTQTVVTCQDERSQIKNKAKAMRILRARLLEKKKSEQEAQISQDRKQQVGTGDRSGRVRTYNFPDRRVTDHRIGLTLHKLEAILEGDMGQLIDALVAWGEER